MKKNIHVLKMGGTIEFIDSAYEGINKNLMKLDTSIDSYLKNLVKPHFLFSIDVICEKDSRDVNEQDLQKLWTTIVASPYNEILITHGTFTMVDTAKFLEDKIRQSSLLKKIIFTGAMVPIVGFSISDAAFNLGYSIASFDAISAGVYICMNGGIFRADEVKKNKEILRFE